MLDPAVHAQLAALLPPSALLTAPRTRGPTSATGSRSTARVPAAVAIPENEAQVVAILQALPRSARAGRRPRRGDEPVRRRDAGPQRRRAVAGQVHADPRDRPARAHRGRRSRACATSRSPKRRRRTGSSTRRIRRRRSPARSAATSPRTPAASIASSTGSPCTTCGACAACSSPARSSSSAATRSTRPATTCSRSINGSEGLLAVITEITVKLTPKPQQAQVALAAFDDIVQAGAAVVRRHLGGHRARRPRDDGPGGHARGRGVRPRRTIRSTRRPCCWSRPTARRRKSPPRWRRSGAC